MAVLNLPSGVARLTRRLISIQGPDAAKFLQGMMSAATLTRDGQLLPRAPGAAFYSGIFNPQGRLLHDVIVYPMKPMDETQPTPDYFVEADGERTPTLMKLLMFYKLSAKFTMKAVEPGVWDVWHLWDDGRDLSGLAGSRDAGILSKDPRVRGLGWRWLGMKSQLPPAEVEEVSEDAYKLRRYLHGVPEGQDEMPREQALPLEYNMDLMNGIDFQKGCYVGQELQARTKYLGVVQKRVLPCVLYPEDAPMPSQIEYNAENQSISGETIERGTAIHPTSEQGAAGKRDKRPGKWVAGLGNVGLAVCKMAVMTDVVPPAPPKMTLPQPMRSPDDEFRMQLSEGKSVKIKAFVPQWLRGTLKTYHD